MRIASLALAALFLVFTSLAEAQDKPQPAPSANASPDSVTPSTPATLGKPSVVRRARLRSFATPGTVVESPAEMAYVLRLCKEDNTPWHLKCSKLVSTFNELPGLQDLGDIDELADYFEHDTAMVTCPAGTEVEIAGVRADEVEYFKRKFRDGEMCFADTNTNRIVSSAVCFQWVKTELAAYRRRTIQEQATDPRNLGEGDDERWRPYQEDRRSGSRSYDSPSWWSDNKKWVIPAAIGAGVGALLFSHASNTAIACASVGGNPPDCHK